MNKEFDSSFTAFAFSESDHKSLSELIRAIPQLAENHDQILTDLRGVCWETIWVRKAEPESPTKSAIEKQINLTRMKAAALLRELRTLDRIVYKKLDTAEVFPKRNLLGSSINGLHKAVRQFHLKTRLSRAALTGARRGRKKGLAGNKLAFSVGVLLHHHGVTTSKSEGSPWASLLEVLCPIAGIQAKDVTNYMREINPEDFQLQDPSTISIFQKSPSVKSKT